MSVFGFQKPGDSTGVCRGEAHMSNRNVGADDRRAFLMWFGTNLECKDPSALHVIRFLLSAPDRLAQLRIIEDCTSLRPLIVISSYGQATPGLLYQTETWSTSDGDAIVADLSLLSGLVYLAPFFPRRTDCRLFLAAREEGLAPAGDQLGAAILDLETARLFADLGLEKKRAQLMILIDQALERRDRDAFETLVALLKKLPGCRDLSAARGREDRS